MDASEHSVAVTRDLSKFQSRVQISAVRLNTYSSLFMDLSTPPSGLTPSGLKLWKKETEKGILPHLYSIHFTDWDSYDYYRESRDLAPYKIELLSGVENPQSIDPRFLRNLCKILHRIEDDLSGKTDRPDPDY